MPEISPMAFLIPFAAYLLGSIPFGLLLAKLFGGMDVRKVGSGNIGATNVARVVGPLAGTLTLVFDTAKGAAAVWLAGRFTNQSATWMMMPACRRRRPVALPSLRSLLAFCFAGLHRGGRGHAAAHLFSVGPASCAADHHRRRNPGHRSAGDLQT